MADKRRGVLQDHKKVRNRLKSPWLTEFNFQFVSYIDQILPEIVLLGLLNDAHGYARGAELSLALARALESIGTFPRPLVSAFGKCTADEIRQIAQYLRDDLAHVQIAVAPLLSISPEHPLRELDTVKMTDAECISRMRECVDRLYDRNSTPACAAMANLYYVQAVQGKIHIAQGLRVPNLESIITDPDSENAQHASSSVRMHAQMLIGHLHEQESTNWPSVFWHCCYLASDCEPKHG